MVDKKKGFGGESVKPEKKELKQKEKIEKLTSGVLEIVNNLSFEQLKQTVRYSNEVSDRAYNIGVDLMEMAEKSNKHIFEMYQRYISYGLNLGNLKKLQPKLIDIKAMNANDKINVNLFHKLVSQTYTKENLIFVQEFIGSGEKFFLALSEIEHIATSIKNNRDTKLSQLTAAFNTKDLSIIHGQLATYFESFERLFLVRAKALGISIFEPNEEREKLRVLISILLVLEFALVTNFNQQNTIIDIEVLNIKKGEQILIEGKDFDLEIVLIKAYFVLTKIFTNLIENIGHGEESDLLKMLLQLLDDERASVSILYPKDHEDYIKSNLAGYPKECRKKINFLKSAYDTQLNLSAGMSELTFLEGLINHISTGKLNTTTSTELIDKMPFEQKEDGLEEHSDLSLENLKLVKPILDRKDTQKTTINNVLTFINSNSDYFIMNGSFQKEIEKINNSPALLKNTLKFLKLLAQVYNEQKHKTENNGKSSEFNIFELLVRKSMSRNSDTNIRTLTRKQSIQTTGSVIPGKVWQIRLNRAIRLTMDTEPQSGKVILMYIDNPKSHQ